MGDTSKQTILIVDDEPPTVSLLEKILKMNNYSIITASNGEIAFKKVTHDRPDIILLDIVMQGLNGFEICQRLKSNKKSKDIPIIFMTSLTNEEQIIKAFSVGAVDYITKPIKKKELLARISTHLKIHMYQKLLQEEVETRTSELQRRMNELENEITYRKNYESKLQVSQERLTKFMESATDGFILLDSELNYLEMNRMALEITGLKRENVLGKNIINVVPQIKESGRYDDYKKVIKTNKPYQIFDVISHPPAEDKHIVTKAFKVGEGIGFILKDVTKRTIAEKKVRDSEEKYRILFKFASDALFLVDVRTMRLLDVNNVAVTLYGYSYDELLQMKATDLSAEVEKTTEVFRKSHLTSIPIRYHKKKNGTVFPVEITSNYFELNNNYSNLSIVRDISERVDAEKQKQKMEQQMQQSQKMEAIGQLAAGVAHEINNPTGFISSNINTLGDYFKDIDILLQYYHELVKGLKTFNEQNLSDDIKKNIQTISEHEKNFEINYLRDDIPELLSECKVGASQIASIVGDLKRFAHPGNGERVLFDINKGIESTLNVAANEIKYKATVIKDFGEIPMIECYPQKLNQVFLNILVNAAQAIEEKGEIRIQTKKVSNQVIISISDTGCGIKKESLSKVFDPFFTTKEIGKGTGLGMNITYNIIKEHKGTIDVKSLVGKGTTFTIALPEEIHHG